MRPLPTISWLAAAYVLAGCAPIALSPSARTIPLESSATLDEGTVAVQASGLIHAGSATNGGGGSVRGRIGLAPRVEAQAEATYAYVDYHDERAPHLGAARAGLKYAPIEHVALVAGLGGGAHAHGAFVAPDVGLVLAYENRYVVPWTAARGWVSLPVDPRAVTVTVSRADGPPDAVVLVPPNTAGWQISTGVRVPISLDASRGTSMSLLAGGAITSLHGLAGGEEYRFWELGTGVELVFAP